MKMKEFGPGGVTGAPWIRHCSQLYLIANNCAKTNHVTTYLTSSTAESQFVISDMRTMKYV